MKKTLFLIALLLCGATALAGEYNYTFHATRLADALTRLADEHPQLRINFICNELDHYRTSAQIDTDDAYEALRQLVGQNPVSIVKKNGRYYLEALQEGKFAYMGRTVDTEDEPLVGATVMILAPKDSTVITYGTTDADGYFTIPCDRKNILLKFSSIGYMPQYKASTGFEVGKVVMSPSPIMLNNLSVDADYTTLQSDKNTYIPTSRQKNASQTAVDLLRRMAIPQLVINPSDNSVKDIFGNPVALFINYQPAEGADLTGMKTTDVRKVEYIEFATDARFKGQPRVVNFIVAEYEYGGYTKISEAASTLNGISNKTNLFSRFTYRKMTYDIFAGSQNEDYHHTGTDLSEEYRLTSDGIDKTVVRDLKLKESHSRTGEYPLTFRATYATPRFTTRHGVSFTHASVPVQTEAGELKVNIDPDKNYAYDRSTPNRHNTVSYQGNLWALIGNNFSIDLSPNFQHTHRNNTSLYESTLIGSTINNSASENTYNWQMKANARLALGGKSQLQFALGYGQFRHKLTYIDSYNMQDSYTTDFALGTAGYTFSTKKLRLNCSAGFNYGRNSINGITTTDLQPNFNIWLSLTLNKKSQLSTYLYYETITPGIDMLAADIVRSNEYLYLTANPYLTNWRQFRSNLAYNWFSSNALSLAVFSGYDLDIDRVATVYEPYNGGSALLRNFVNNGNYANFYCGSQVNYKLLSNSLQLYGNVSYNHFRTTGLFDNSYNTLRVQLQAVYYWRSFSVLASYVSPRNVLTENSNVIIRRKDFYTLSVGWGNGTWNIQLSANNFFKNGWTSSQWTQTTPLYSQLRRDFSPSAHRSLALSVTYTVGYGKKINRSNEATAQQSTTSAILK